MSWSRLSRCSSARTTRCAPRAHRRPRYPRRRVPGPRTRDGIHVPRVFHRVLHGRVAPRRHLRQRLGRKASIRSVVGCRRHRLARRPRGGFGVRLGCDRASTRTAARVRRGLRRVPGCVAAARHVASSARDDWRHVLLDLSDPLPALHPGEPVPRSDRAAAGRRRARDRVRVVDPSRAGRRGGVLCADRASIHGSGLARPRSCTFPCLQRRRDRHPGLGCRSRSPASASCSGSEAAANQRSESNSRVAAGPGSGTLTAVQTRW
jgi:hypothetical protein